jgi:dihydroneopterin aldolase
MADRILLQGLTFFGHHGVADVEQAVGGRYRLDVALTLDLAEAGASDALADTVDYAEVARVAVAVGTGRRFRLLEALAEAVAAALLERFPADGVRVRVTKAQPPLAEIGVGAAAVEIERRRDGATAPPDGEGR